MNNDEKENEKSENEKEKNLIKEEIGGIVVALRIRCIDIYRESGNVLVQ